MRIREIIRQYETQKKIYDIMLFIEQINGCMQLTKDKSKGGFMVFRAERIPSRVEYCLKYRMNYPRKLFDFLYSECGFSKDAVIADIGSGVGSLARHLLERGSRVVGIEAEAELKDTAERILCDEFPRFVSIKGSPFHTTLSEGSVHHIICDQTLNGLDIHKSQYEFSRILRPGGTVAFITVNKLNQDDFLSEFEGLIKRFSKNSDESYSNVSSVDYARFFGDGNYAVLSLPGNQVFDFNGLRGNLLSNKFIPCDGEEGFGDMMEELQILFELYSISGKITLNYEIMTYAGKLNYSESKAVV